MGIDKIYNPKVVENKWLNKWKDQNLFKSVPDEREAYTIVIPPPNVTGILHMGHMLNNTIQDILIRRARLKGYNACWVPGTDHASIATEAKVVKMLREKGITKNDISRDDFLNHAWDWTDKHGGLILNQLKRIGCSCDWTRTKFTLDDEMSDSVTDTFISLFNDGLLYRDKKIVNWDPEAQTTLSNEEVIYKEEETELYYLKYKIAETDEFLSVATTRPETIFGDTAVAVNPNDKRYKKLKNKKLIVPLVDRIVPIVFDDSVEIGFGTGCLKVTPAHSEKDFIIGKKNDLEIIDIFNDDATLNNHASNYSGQDRFKVKKQIVKELSKKGLIDKKESYIHNIALSERTNCVVEPKLSLQWFVKMKKLAKPAIKAVLSGEVKFYPKKYINTYKNWMENIRDWNISRQLYWGHRIPVYYLKKDNSKFVVAKSIKEALGKFKSNFKIPNINVDDIKQDVDVLDTWFSSWLWPISVFDGIRKPNNKDIDYYYPTSDIVTGPDILFFWIARMIMSGFYFKNKKPFNNVYFTGLVRDDKGRKMSKQLGNSPDPIELIENYGADGVRIGLLFSAPAGNDLLFDEKLCIQGKNFSNKIWNAFRLINGFDLSSKKEQTIYEIAAIKWFNENLNLKINQINQSFDKFKISEALMTTYKLVWDDFCSTFLEIVKPSYGDKISIITIDEINVFFKKILSILEPFMPFISQELNEKLNFLDKKLKWPDTNDHDQNVIDNFNHINELVTKVRNFKKTNNIPFKDSVKLFYDNKILDDELKSVLKKLTYSELIYSKNQSNSEMNSIMIGKYIYYIKSEKALSEDDISKIKESLDYNIGFKKILEKKLSNKNFVDNAPKNVVDNEKKKLEDVHAKIIVLENKLKNFLD
ncbi:MAG: valine--tRNA ligase [Flavobacteriaceae bacterium]|nr:valine--tRNA ligase [Flavobacteriaceae bacterium]